ncbi:MAG: viroplasmin family protein [Clostridium sp.]|uniref:ribonuclease H1 domain-containing protein n=1 Tax=Clostridium sp. TaxID=1506 RepID=UPI003F2EFF27
MAKKVYAIKEGFDSKNGVLIKNKIVCTWAECLSYVKGVKGAKYKSFQSLEEANAYLSDTNTLLKKGRDEYPIDCAHIYVDGSYNISTKRYAYGVVVVEDDIVKYMESGAEDSVSSIRQIAGELDGAIKGIEYALSKGMKKVVLFHDYEGIFHHATGSWDRKDESSTNYYNKMNSLFEKGIEVTFVKVDSHTGDLFNELADEICKEELNITSEKIVERWLKTNKLLVETKELKERILKLARNASGNIVVVGEEEKKETTINIEKDIIIESSAIKKELLERIEKLSEEDIVRVNNYIKRYIK